MQTELLTPLLYCFDSLTPSAKGTWEIVEDSPAEARCCTKCRRPKTHYRQHRPGKTTLNNYRCHPCKNKRLALKARQKKDEQGRSVKGQAIMDQRGLAREERLRLSELRISKKKYLERKGWSSHTLNKYGLSLEAYLELLEKQDYKCAIDGCEF